ncbi:uncharacterized protein LOC142581899 [Dermacentor variabilis]|uniref:uncharacterized protein LOC142581899 n=1 Tax=Dermacentor variabilis TaxID=34621 RepID=UPI003F5BC521
MDDDAVKSKHTHQRRLKHTRRKSTTKSRGAPQTTDPSVALSTGGVTLSPPAYPSSESGNVREADTGVLTAGPLSSRIQPQEEALQTKGATDKSHSERHGHRQRSKRHRHPEPENQQEQQQEQQQERQQERQQQQPPDDFNRAPTPLAAENSSGLPAGPWVPLPAGSSPLDMGRLQVSGTVHTVTTSRIRRISEAFSEWRRVHLTPHDVMFTEENGCAHPRHPFRP